MRMPLDDITTNPTVISFSAYSFADSSTLPSETEKKVPFQWQGCYGDLPAENESEREKVTCMICDCNLNSLTLLERSAHVNHCIDQKGSKLKTVRLTKSPKPRSANDENDVASIFSPNSSSTIIAGHTMSNRNIRSRGNVKKKSAMPFSKEKKSTRSVEIDIKPSISDDGTINFSEISGQNHPSVSSRMLAAASASRMKPKDNPDFPRAHIQSNVDTSINMKMNTITNDNISMSMEEMELFHLRLQLGEYSAREAELRVKKAMTMKNIKKVMKKVAKKSESEKKLTLTVISEKDYGNYASEEIQETIESKLMKKIAFDSAMSILFPENYDSNTHDDAVGPTASEATNQVMSAHIIKSGCTDSEINLKDGGNKFIKKDENMSTVISSHENCASILPFSRLVSLLRESPLWSLSTQISDDDMLKVGGKIFLQENIFGDPTLENLGILDNQRDSEIIQKLDANKIADIETEIDLEYDSPYPSNLSPCLSAEKCAEKILPNEDFVNAVDNSGFIAVPSSGLIAVPTSGFIAVPTSGLIAVPTSGFIAVPTSGLIAVPTSGSISIVDSFQRLSETVSQFEDCQVQELEKESIKGRNVTTTVCTASKATVCLPSSLSEREIVDSRKSFCSNDGVRVLHCVEKDLLYFSVQNAKLIIELYKSADPDIPLPSISSEQLILHLLEISQLSNMDLKSDTTLQPQILSENSSFPSGVGQQIEMMKSTMSGKEVEYFHEETNSKSNLLITENSPDKQNESVSGSSKKIKNSDDSINQSVEGRALRGSESGKRRGKELCLSLSLTIPISPFPQFGKKFDCKNDKDPIEESVKNRNDVYDSDNINDTNDGGSNNEGENDHTDIKKNVVHDSLEGQNMSDDTNIDDMIDNSQASSSIMSTFGCLEGGASTYTFLDSASQNSEKSMMTGCSLTLISTSANPLNDSIFAISCPEACSGEEYNKESSPSLQSRSPYSRSWEPSPSPSPPLSPLRRCFALSFPQMISLSPSKQSSPLPRLSSSHLENRSSCRSHASSPSSPSSFLDSVPHSLLADTSLSDSRDFVCKKMKRKEQLVEKVREELFAEEALAHELLQTKDEESEYGSEVRTALYAKNVEIFENLKIEIDRNCLAKQLSEKYSTRSLPASSQPLYPSSFPSFFPSASTSSSIPTSPPSSPRDRGEGNGKGEGVRMGGLITVRKRTSIVRMEAGNDRSWDGGTTAQTVGNEVIAIRIAEENSKKNGRFKFDGRSREISLTEFAPPNVIEKESRATWSRLNSKQVADVQEFQKVVSNYGCSSNSIEMTDQSDVGGRQEDEIIVPLCSLPLKAPASFISSKIISSSSSSSSSSLSSSSTSSSSCASISLDVFKSKEEPNFDKYSVSELQKLCAAYGLKKDTKTRLTSILLTMWKKMQKQSVKSSTSSSSSSSSAPAPVPVPAPDRLTDCRSSENVFNCGTSDAGRIPEKVRETEVGAGAGIKDNVQNQKKTAAGKPKKNMKKSIEIASEDVLAYPGPGNMLTQVPVVLKRKRSNANEGTKNVPENQKKRAEYSLSGDDNFQMDRLRTNKNRIVNNTDNVIEGEVCGGRTHSKEDMTTKQIVLSFLRNQSDLHMMILCFEPLDLDSVYKRLSSQGFKLSKPELLEILDSECFFVSCGMVAKARQRENKKLNPKHVRNRSKK